VFRLAIAVSVAAAACTSATAGTHATAPSLARPTLRAYRVSTSRTITFDEMAAAAARADIVFFGEQHDDAETHFAEFALLDAIGRTRTNVVLSLEMFERDVQSQLDDYLAGRMSESAFLAASRPWDNYPTDYRPLVLLARTRGWPVIAANVPRPIASAVSRKGLAALDTLPLASRAFAARELQCPHDAYYDRFAIEMSAHPGAAPASTMSAADAAAMRTMTDRFYEAQCVKDETMAESVVRALERAGPGAIVVHVTGDFHADFRQGTVERVRRRAPNIARVVISAVPVPDPAGADAGTYAARGDFVLFTRAAPPK
jgi:uncharacterized iron-regulated protein